jgi:hypothetical protein
VEPHHRRGFSWFIYELVVRRSKAAGAFGDKLAVARALG